MPSDHLPDPEARRAWLALAAAVGLGPRTLALLVDRLGGPLPASRARRRELEPVVGRRARVLGEALARADPDRVERDAHRAGQAVLTPADPDWPAEAFRPLVDPPPALFVRGRLPPCEAPSVAVVGTRRATSYGLRTAGRLAEDLARKGFWVVSGLAVGIDGEAHAAALRAAPSGGTVAVLGCGLDHPYPVQHLDLREQVAREGGLLSEHPPGTPPVQGNFPRRNRIVAALAQAVVVVEAPLKSGALITARLANSMGREVLAVPGAVDRFTHEGCHALLKRGEAALLTEAGDVLRALGFETAPGSGDGRGLPPPPEGPARALWNAMDPDEASDPDALALATGLTPDEVSEALSLLELDGRVVRVPGAGWRRRP